MRRPCWGSQRPGRNREWAETHLPLEVIQLVTVCAVKIAELSRMPQQLLPQDPRSALSQTPQSMQCGRQSSCRQRTCSGFRDGRTQHGLAPSSVANEPTMQKTPPAI